MVRRRGLFWGDMSTYDVREKFLEPSCHSKSCRDSLSQSGYKIAYPSLATELLQSSPFKRFEPKASTQTLHEYIIII